MDGDSFTSEHLRAVHGLGMFILAWSVLEAYLEFLIARQLTLSPLDGSLVTADLSFKARARLLKGLLHRDSVKNDQAITELNALMNKPDRNDLFHSMIGSNEDGLVFTRREAAGMFKSTEKPYSGPSLLRLAVEITETTTRLRSALGATEKDYLSYFQSAYGGAKSSNDRTVN